MIRGSVPGFVFFYFRPFLSCGSSDCPRIARGVMGRYPGDASSQLLGSQCARAAEQLWMLGVRSGGPRLIANIEDKMGASCAKVLRADAVRRPRLMVVPGLVNTTSRPLPKTSASRTTRRCQSSPQPSALCAVPGYVAFTSDRPAEQCSCTSELVPA